MPGLDSYPIEDSSASGADGPHSSSANENGGLDIPSDPAALAEKLSVRLAETDDLRARIDLIGGMIAGKIVFSTSLGLEDQALLHAIAGSPVSIEIVTLDTGRHFQETYDTLARSERRLKTRIKVFMPDAKDVEDLVARDGISGFRDSIENRKACCEVRKVRPLQRALAGAAAWITGLRREQSANRDSTPFAAFDASQSLIKINPLADWSLDRVENYIETNSIPINPLHAEGFPSIGCQPCTRAIAPGEPIRAGRWWWENEDRKECGLHNRPRSSKGARL